MEPWTAPLTVRNQDDDVVRRFRIRAFEHVPSAEAEHQKRLRLALVSDDGQAAGRKAVAQRLAASRRRTAGRR